VFIDATSREVRVRQIDSKLRILAKEVISLIGQYYHSGDYNKVLQERVTKVMSLIKEITYSMSKYNSFGSILDSLNIEEKIPWKTMFDLNNPIYSYGDNPTSQIPENINSGNVKINPDKLLDEVSWRCLLGGIANENSLESSQSGNSENGDSGQKVVKIKNRSEIFADMLYSQNWEEVY